MNPIKSNFQSFKSVDAYFVVCRHTVYDHDYDRETHDCDHDTHGHNNAAEEHCGHHDHNYGVDVLLGNSDVVPDAIDHFDNPCDHYYPGGSKGHVGHGNFEVVEILEIVDKHFDDQRIAVVVSTAAVNIAVDIGFVVDLG